MSKSVGNIATLREVLDRWGRETLLVFFLGGHWRKPIDFSDETMAQAAAQAEGLRERLSRALDAGTGGRLGAVRGGARRRLQHARPRSPSCTSGATTSCCSARARALRARLARRARARRRPRSSSSPSAASGARERATSSSPTALRDEIEAAGWEMRDEPRRLRARPRAVSADLVYGRRAVREALRGRREVLELLATERAVAAEPWLAEAQAEACRRERELSELAGTRDHQGVVARVEPYRYADAYELAPAERPLLAVLDRVTDPRNLGAVCRSAEGAGATGVVVPAHGSAVVTPAVARCSAGAIEHLPIAVVTNLARYLERGEGARALGLRRRGAAPQRRCGRPTSTGGVALVFGAEGRGLRPLVARSCDALVSIPLAGEVESLNVSVAAALLLYEARRQRARPAR